jgi:hypothetical protein
LREQARDQKARDKAQKRQERASRPSGEAGSGEDPDIAGIVPGPQAQPWMDGGGDAPVVGGGGDEAAREDD